MAEWIENYVRQAKDCRQAAARAATPAERDYVLHMADRWEELARQRAVFLNLEGVLNGLLDEDDNRKRNQSLGSAGASSP